MKLKSMHLDAFVSRLQHALSAGVRPERLIGLDISPDQIKMAVARRWKGEVILEAYHHEYLAGSSQEDQKDIHTCMLATLQALVKRNRLQGMSAVSALPFQNYETRMVILPKMPRKELQNAILFEAKKFSRIAPENAYIDHVKIDEFEQEGARYVSHLVLAADRRDVDQTIKLLEGAGLKAAGITVPSLALRNIISGIIQGEKESIVAAIDMSRTEMSFSLFQQGMLRFTRDLPVSMRTLIEALKSIVISGAETIRLEEEKAEEIIRNYGIVDESNCEGETKDGIPLSKIAVMLRPVLEKMLIEIQRSIDFCQEQFGIAPPGRLYICSGAIFIKNMREFLGSKLPMEVEYLTSKDLLKFASSEIPEEGFSEHIEIGAALGSALGVVYPGDYYVPDKCVRGTNRYVKAALTLAATACVFAVMFIYLAGHVEERKVRAQFKEKLATLENLEQFENIHKAEAMAVRLRKLKREMLLGLVGPNISWGEALKDLSNRLSEDVQLTELRLVPVHPQGEEGPVDIRLYFHGLLSLQDERIEITISRMLTSLAESPFFEDVRLEAVKALKAGVAKVDFNCRLIS